MMPIALLVSLPLCPIGLCPQWMDFGYVVFDGWEQRCQKVCPESQRRCIPAQGWYQNRRDGEEHRSRPAVWIKARFWLLDRRLIMHHNRQSMQRLVPAPLAEMNWVLGLPSLVESNAGVLNSDCNSSFTYGKSCRLWLICRYRWCHLFVPSHLLGTFNPSAAWIRAFVSETNECFINAMVTVQARQYILLMFVITGWYGGLLTSAHVNTTIAFRARCQFSPALYANYTPWSKASAVNTDVSIQCTRHSRKLSQCTGLIHSGYKLT